MQARIDPKTRVRRLHQVDLWEISIVTFPLLAGARVRAVKAASSSRPQPSPARRRAAILVVPETLVQFQGMPLEIISRHPVLIRLEGRSGSFLSARVVARAKAAL